MSWPPKGWPEHPTPREALGALSRVVPPIIRRNMPTTVSCSWAENPAIARRDNYRRMLK